MAVGIPVVGAIACVSVGVLIGVFATQASAPSQLQSPQPITWGLASESALRDEKYAVLALSIRPQARLASPRGGTISSVDCTAGKILASGETNFSVDGVQLLNLATEVPLWRSLQLGEEGLDVASAKRALTALGQATSDDNEWDRSAANAYAAALKSIGAPVPAGGALDISTVLWMPTDAPAVAECPAVLGSSTQPGTPLAVTQAILSEAVLQSIHAGAVPGARRMSGVDAANSMFVGTPINDADSLQVIASSKEFVEREAGATTITIQTELSEPVRALTMPPGAIHSVNGSDGCITFRSGDSLKISITTSVLGASVVAWQDGVIGEELALTRPTQKPCA